MGQGIRPQARSSSRSGFGRCKHFFEASSRYFPEMYFSAHLRTLCCVPAWHVTEHCEEERKERLLSGINERSIPLMKVLQHLQKYRSFIAWAAAFKKEPQHPSLRKSEIGCRGTRLGGTGSAVVARGRVLCHGAECYGMGLGVVAQEHLALVVLRQRMANLKHCLKTRTKQAEHRSMALWVLGAVQRETTRG